VSIGSGPSVRGRSVPAILRTDQDIRAALDQPFETDGDGEEEEEDEEDEEDQEEEEEEQGHHGESGELNLLLSPAGSMSQLAGAAAQELHPGMALSGMICARGEKIWEGNGS
jgi:ABC-type Zn2+ transport system substrate-binding protein/surface adhesin